jgi:uncharacterized protein YjiS (DUF1127 family)
MANVAIVERRSSRGFDESKRPPQLAGIIARIQRGAAAFRAAIRRIRTEAEIRRKLGDVDDYLLRDIGLVRTNGRIESIDIQRCLGYRRSN